MMHTTPGSGGRISTLGSVWRCQSVTRCTPYREAGKGAAAGQQLHLDRRGEAAAELQQHVDYTRKQGEQPHDGSKMRIIFGSRVAYNTNCTVLSKLKILLRIKCQVGI